MRQSGRCARRGGGRSAQRQAVPVACGLKAVPLIDRPAHLGGGQEKPDDPPAAALGHGQVQHPADLECAVVLPVQTEALEVSGPAFKHQPGGEDPPQGGLPGYGPTSLSTAIGM